MSEIFTASVYAQYSNAEGHITEVTYKYRNRNSPMSYPQWLRAVAKSLASPLHNKEGRWLGWKYGSEIYPFEALTVGNYKRVAALMPNGIPRYVRCYDRGPDAIPSERRYTVVYSGRNGKGQFLFSDGNPKSRWFRNSGRMTDALGDYERGRLDTNESGFSPAVGRRHPELGLHIPFQSLPDELKPTIVADYRALWKLPQTIKEAQLAQNVEVKVEDGPNEPLPEMPQPVLSGEALALALESVAPKRGMSKAEEAHRLDSLQAIAEKAKKAKGLNKVRFVVDDYLNVIGVFLGEPERLHSREKAVALIREVWPIEATTLSGEYRQLNKGADIEEEEAIAYARSKERPATDEDKRAAIAQAERQGLIPSRVAQTQTVKTPHEQDRLRLDRRAVEEEYTRAYWKKGLPISETWHWSDEGYALGLFDCGITDDRGGAVVDYVLIGPFLTPDGDKLDIIFEGQDFHPSPLIDDPTGPDAAVACLELIVLDIAEEPTERQERFYEQEAEQMDCEWPKLVAGEEQVGHV